jgi:acyl-CoA thioesterase
MSPEEKAKAIVDLMYNQDPYSQWLGIERVLDAPGKSILKMRVRAEMLNGFSIAHGGITFSLADSALAFASNTHGVQCVSVETSISHVKKVWEGDVLTTEVEEKSITSRMAVYHITIFNQKEEAVAFFKGTVFRTGKDWEVISENGNLT